MKIQFSKKAVKFLKKQNKEQSRWINGKIRELADNPVPHDAKILSGFHNQVYRIRIGDYRVMYELDKKDQIIGIVKIDKRGRAY